MKSRRVDIYEIQDPKAGPGPQPKLAHFPHLIPLNYINKISEKIPGSP